MEMALPNVHYFAVDYNRFPKLNLKDYKNEVMLHCTYNYDIGSE